MKTLKKAVENSGMTKKELSIKLGYQAQYITNALNRGVSTELQNMLVERINLVTAGEVFKNDNEIIAELTVKLDEAQAMVEHNAKCAHKYLNQLHAELAIKNKTMDDLKALNEKYAKLQDDNANLSSHYNDEFMFSESLKNTNTELNSEINAARKNAQEDRTAFLKLKADNDAYKQEIAELGQTAGKQHALNIALNDENTKLVKEKAEIQALYENEVTNVWKDWLFMFVSILIVNIIFYWIMKA